MEATIELRTLGLTDILVSPAMLGCWPIAGMTSLDVNDRDSLATLEACLEAGVNFLDTAYCYGAPMAKANSLIVPRLGAIAAMSWSSQRSAAFIGKEVGSRSRWTARTTAARDRREPAAD